MVAVGDGGGAGGREGERMDIGDRKQPSYMDYVQMWRHIMDPSKLKVSVCLLWLSVSALEALLHTV